MSYPLQLTEDGKQLRHFLAIEGLSAPLLTQLLDDADQYLEAGLHVQYASLKAKTVVNLFFEASTRTLCSFELAERRLAANVLTVDINNSSTSKGETLVDTLHTLEAMGVDMFVMRHPQAGAADFIAKHVQPHVAVLNAGDGQHEHPTQALLDMLSIRRVKKEFGHLTVAIIGDILHSRVARSQIYALSILGAAEIRVIAPKTLLPSQVKQLGVKVFHNLEEGLAGVDVVIALRLQRERMHSQFLPSEQEFFKQYGLTKKSLAYAKADAIVLHPAPLNRGVEISTDVANGEQSHILRQVTHGVAVRMAVMAHITQVGENKGG